MYDLLSIGDTQNDTFLQLNEKEVHVVCKLNTDDCEICFNYADKIPVEAVHRSVAGNAANIAVSGARLGLKTALWTILGDDSFGREAVATFEREGVTTELVSIEKGTQSNVSTVINVYGERTILVYHWPRAYHLPQLPDAKYYYLTSMAAGSESIFDDIASLASKNHTKLVFQPGTYQLRIGPGRAKVILHHTELIFMNVEEAQLYTNTSTTDPKNLLTALKKLGSRIVVVTDGKNGSYSYDGQEMLKMGIVEQAPRIEATGAGDAFAAGFTAARIKGKSIEEAMRWGNYNASAVIQKIGPQAGLLTEKEIHKWEKKYPLKAQKL